MSRDVIRLTIDDLSQFAKTLRGSFETPPSHTEMLGHIARAAGYRNYQHLRARNTPVPQADPKRLARALRLFDAEGRMIRWPGKTSLQALCLWAVWAQLPPRTEMTERAISARIDTLTAFRDAAQIRRGMVENRMVTRDREGRAYLRVEQAPPADAQALIAALRDRWRATAD